VGLEYLRAVDARGVEGDGPSCSVNHSARWSIALIPGRINSPQVFEPHFSLGARGLPAFEADLRDRVRNRERNAVCVTRAPVFGARDP
jgi:hypothetical protein